MSRSRAYLARKKKLETALALCAEVAFQRTDNLFDLLDRLNAEAQALEEIMARKGLFKTEFQKRAEAIWDRHNGPLPLA